MGELIHLCVLMVELTEACQTYQMSAKHTEATVFENECVELTCRVPGQESVTISREPNVFVKGWGKLGNDSRTRYKFHLGELTEYSTILHSFTIDNISAGDAGLYVCVYATSFAKSTSLTVIIRPNQGDPLCKTKNKYPVHLVDEIMQMNCSVDHGTPEVTLSFLSMSNMNITNRTELVPKVGRKVIGIETTLSQSSNGSTLVCSARQNYPPNKIFTPSYNAYCSWGPIILQQQLEISLYYVTENVTNVLFICKCNIMDAQFNWVIKPNFLSVWQSNWPGQSIVAIDVTNRIDSFDDMTVTCQVSYEGSINNATAVYRLYGSYNSSTGLSYVILSVVLLLVSFSVNLFLGLRLYVVKLSKHRAACTNIDTSDVYTTTVRPYSTVLPTCFDCFHLRAFSFFKGDFKGRSDRAEGIPSPRDDNSSQLDQQGDGPTETSSIGPNQSRGKRQANWALTDLSIDNRSYEIIAEDADFKSLVSGRRRSNTVEVTNYESVSAC
ncbi:uncharacterized protein [Apostichopus japonicus]|uniref:uncharacterized protein n=1 Tax=Stichopus japonicus TaxID=307972 RepID=UPI003AB63496